MWRSLKSLYSWREGGREKKNTKERVRGAKCILVVMGRLRTGKGGESKVVIIECPN